MKKLIALLAIFSFSAAYAQDAAVGSETAPTEQVQAKDSKKGVIKKKKSVVEEEIKTEEQAAQEVK